MEFVVARSIEDVAPSQWNAFFPGELEDWSYYRATETAGLSDLEWFYFCLRDGGRLRAAVPAFATRYRLDTTLDGGLRRLVAGLARAAPGLLRPRMLALGSPVAETCHFGFDSANEEERMQLLCALLDGCERFAADQGTQLLAIKDLPEPLTQRCSELLRARGLRRQPALPTASLALPFASVDAYLAQLSRATRRDLRRKLRTRSQLRVEWRREIEDIHETIMQLYENTLTRAGMQLERLTARWFTNVLAGLGERAHCVCYWLGERLVAFNLVLHDGERLIDKYIGMDYADARGLNLYYLSWMENVRYAIEHGITTYQSGQGLSDEKRRLGSTLTENGLWYRHRNGLIDGAMRMVERAARLDRTDANAPAFVGAMQ